MEIWSEKSVFEPKHNCVNVSVKLSMSPLSLLRKCQLLGSHGHRGSQGDGKNDREACSLGWSEEGKKKLSVFLLP